MAFSRTSSNRSQCRRRGTSGLRVELNSTVGSSHSPPQIPLGGRESSEANRSEAGGENDEKNDERGAAGGRLPATSSSKLPLHALENEQVTFRDALTSSNQCLTRFDGHDHQLH